MLVSHFRTVSRGFILFTAEWDQRQAVQVAGNEKEAVEYMKAMSQQVPKFGITPACPRMTDAELNCKNQSNTWHRGRRRSIRGRTATASVACSLRSL